MREKGAVETVLQLVEKAEVLTEGYRPGVALERLGLGPISAWNATRGWSMAA